MLFRAGSTSLTPSSCIITAGVPARQAMYYIDVRWNKVVHFLEVAYDTVSALCARDSLVPEVIGCNQYPLEYGASGYRYGVLWFYL